MIFDLLLASESLRAFAECDRPRADGSREGSFPERGYSNIISENLGLLGTRRR